MNFFCGLGTPANGMIQRVPVGMEVETGMVFNGIERVESCLSGIEVLQDIGNRLLAGVCEIGKWHRDFCSSRNKKATQRFEKVVVACCESEVVFGFFFISSKPGISMSMHLRLVVDAVKRQVGAGCLVQSRSAQALIKLS